ncbi:NB-ARC domain-containing protein [Verrucosispora sp. WMMA2121]|uniref:WD40 domain-containing protein n=1 Tax=Verrucosispora sp. WMMA2121 TaxID=3015164 RepID=UPI0022B6E2DB|nr:NB-ARC domain-containing protein [Verrucosispora sp. WMMA2121]MCZ7422961.1 NB-ARC domain-containing protein [Verrucosispora sp. WMMA2121]
MRRAEKRRAASWMSRLGTTLATVALTAICLFLPVWALTKDGDLNAVAGWANILAFPATFLGMVLVMLDQRRAAKAKSKKGVDPSVRRPWMAPPLDRMVDRPDLGRVLLDLLTAPVSSEVGLTTQMQGAGGFGKTQMATWASHQPEVAGRYPGGLLWVTLGQEVHGADLAARINDLVFVLSGQRPAVGDPDAAGAEMGRVLDGLPPVLLIIDDVWTESQLRPFRIGGQAATRLVTTRVASLLADDSPRLIVDMMSAAQAQALVADGLPQLPKAQVERLARLAGYWPVLLNLINGVLRQRVNYGQRPEDAGRTVIAELVAEGPGAFDPTEPSERNQAVAATVGASLKVLAANDRQRYLELGVFPEDVDIPQSVLEKLWQGTRVARLCESLVRLGLLADYRLDAPGPRVLLHDVMRAYLRSQRSTDDWSRVHGRLVDAVAARLPAGDHGPEWWKLPDADIYLWQYLPYHLHYAGRASALAALVCDLRWVENKTRRFSSVIPAEADLGLADTDVSVVLRKQLANAAALLGPIDPPAALGATLASRLHGIAELQPLLDRYVSTLDLPRLVPAWPLPDRPEWLAGQPGHTGGVTSCAFSPDGGLLATGSDDSTVRIWRVSDGSGTHVLSGHVGGVWACSFHPDGTLLATSSTDRTVRLWDPTTGELLDILYGHTDWVRSCTFSPDGRLLATAGADGTARLWRKDDRRLITTFTGHTAEVRSCAFSVDGTLLATASNDGTVRVWQVSSGTTIVVLPHQEGSVWDCAFSPGGDLLITATSGLVKLWRTADWSPAGTLQGQGDEIDSCAFSPDGRHVAGTSYGIVQLWRLDEGRLPTIFAEHTGAVWGCAFSPDGTLLATASNDQTARIWHVGEAATKQVIAAGASKVNSCAFSPDGSHIMTTDYRGTVVLRDAVTGEPGRALMGHASRVISCAFSPDGMVLATTSKAETILWDAKDGRRRAVLRGHTDWVRSCAFSPDGIWLATASADRTVRIWAVADGSEHASFSDASGFRSCAYSPDGSLLVAGTARGAVRLWRVWEGFAPETLSRHTEGVHSCAFSPDGNLLVTVSGDRTVRIWRVADRNEMRSLSGHTSWADRCAFAPNGRLLATVSNDQTLRIWDVSSGACECAIRVGGPLAWVSWHPEGDQLCTVGGAGTYLFDYVRQPSRP